MKMLCGLKCWNNTILNTKFIGREKRKSTIISLVIDTSISISFKLVKMNSRRPGISSKNYVLPKLKLVEIENLKIHIRKFAKFSKLIT